MTGMVVNLLVNILMAGLLAVTISYCWMLNKRIKILQNSKSELAQLLKHFDESTQRASDSIVALQTASKKIGESIQMRVDKANYLLDDLAFMIEKGSKLANQIEASAAISRARSRVVSEQTPAEDIPPSPASLEEPEDMNGMSREKTRASLEAMLEKVIGRSKAASAAGWPSPSSAQKESPPPRSRTEQELLAMLKAGIKG